MTLGERRAQLGDMHLKKIRMWQVRDVLRRGVEVGWGGWRKSRQFGARLLR